MNYQEKLVTKMPAIVLVKQAGRWVSENGDPVVLYTRVPGVEFESDGETRVLVQTDMNRRLLPPTFRITVAKGGGIISIKEFNNIAFKSPGADPWMDIDMFQIPMNHPLAPSFYVVKEVDHKVYPTVEA